MIYLAVRQRPRGYIGQTVQNTIDHESLHIFRDAAAFRAFAGAKDFSACIVMVFDDTGADAPAPVMHP